MYTIVVKLQNYDYVKKIGNRTCLHCSNVPVDSILQSFVKSIKSNLKKVTSHASLFHFQGQVITLIDDSLRGKNLPIG